MRSSQERGAFVTLTENGQLRGCIGYIAPIEPLYLTVRDVAAHAALRDRRFRPVEPAELASLQYEISVLSPLHRVMDVQEIRIGQHGLVIHKDGTEGILLPQVASEEKWDRAKFLEQICYKAGLPSKTWRIPTRISSVSLRWYSASARESNLSFRLEYGHCSRRQTHHRQQQRCFKKPENRNQPQAE